MIKKTWPPPAFSLSLLGDFRLEFDGRPISGLSYKKGRAVLAYLAGEPGGHDRRKLAEMFWPDLPTKDARNNLRQVLLNLRSCLQDAQTPHPALIVDHQSVRFDPQGHCLLDLTEFRNELPDCDCAPGAPDCHACLAEMARVSDLYRGEFLTGFVLPDCPEFEDWLMVRRESLRRCALARLERLCNCFEQQQRVTEALIPALRYTDLDPWNERGHRRVMRLFARDGQIGNALAQYDYCSRLLKREMDLEVGTETRLLAESIRSGSFIPEKSAPAITPSHPLHNELKTEPEHRQVTVLHCELNPVAVEDPDEALTRRRAVQRRCNEILRQFSGYRVPSQGGGLLAYFGYPPADEQAAVHAVQAALNLCRENFEGFNLCVGAHTGTIVTGDDPNLPDTLGTTTGVAMTFPFHTERTEVLISETTQKLVAEHFALASRGKQKLRGFARPLEVFQVLGPVGIDANPEPMGGKAPLCGREADLARLLELWRDAANGRGRALLLQGEPGIGKSRLLHEVKARLNEEHRTLRELRCLPELRRTPFHPLIDLFKQLLDFSVHDSAPTRFAKLVNYAESHYADQDVQVVPMLAEMLSLPLPKDYAAAGIGATQQREKICALLLERLKLLAARNPLLIIIEDLHWADPSTLDSLVRLLDEISNRAILLLMSARPDFVPPWSEDRVRRLSLPPLSDHEVRRMTKLLAPELADAVVDQIVARADGIPLFVEEITYPARSAPLTEITTIPPTLIDLLTARLDGLGPAKGTAQLAAHIGREFRLDLLEKVSPLDRQTLHARLETLFKTGILQHLKPRVVQFRHILIQEAAYRSQSKAVRQTTHGRIAQALAKDFPELVAARPEILARHQGLAEQYGEAVRSWLKAGNRAAQHSACQEALLHFQEGLKLIDRLPDTVQRQELEFELQVGRGQAACTVQGYGSAEAVAAYQRAMTLAEQNGGGPDRFRAIWGLWAGASSRAGYGHALDLAQQLLRMALRGKDPVQQQQGHFAVGNTLFWRGEFGAARDHLEQAIALYHPRHNQKHLSQFGENVRVTSRAYLSWVLWFLGYPDRAQTVGKETVQLARRLEHPFSLGYAMTFFTLLQKHLGLPEETLASAQETRDLSVAQNFLLWQTAAENMQGWSEVMLGDPDGMPRLRHSVETMRTVMGGVALSFLVPLIEARLQQKDYPEALANLEEAFTIMESLGDRHLEAELHRLKGEGLLGSNPAATAEAETCFQQALTVSRRQQAKALELRAAVSLARLWAKQNRTEEASSLLKSVYNWFKEGFETPELREAEELLEKGI